MLYVFYKDWVHILLSWVTPINTKRFGACYGILVKKLFSPLMFNLWLISDFWKQNTRDNEFKTILTQTHIY
jgi:hypothetical protein